MTRTDDLRAGSAPPAPRAALSRHGEEILRAVAPAVLGPLVPADPGARAEMIEAGLANLDEYVGHLSLPLQKETRILFRVLGSLPARLLLLRTWNRWPDAAPETVESFLRRAHGSRLFLMRRIYTSLQSLAVIAWFDLPAAWNEIGYPGPPIERPVGSGAPS